MGVSADGRIVVGRTWKRENRSYSRGYRWTAENGMEDLGALPGGVGAMLGTSLPTVPTLVYLLLTPLLGAGLSVAGWHGAVLNALLQKGLSGLVAFRQMARSWQGRWVGEGMHCAPIVGYKGWGRRTSARWADIGVELTMFPPTARWWWAGLTTPQGGIMPFAGRLQAACKTSARCQVAEIVRLGAFPPMAWWWSATLTMQQGMTVPFAGRLRARWKT
jgi:hypothetical protein